ILVGWRARSGLLEAERRIGRLRRGRWLAIVQRPSSALRRLLWRLPIVLLMAAALAAGCRATPPTPPISPAPVSTAAAFRNLLDHRGIAAETEDWSFLPFSDQGSWIGWSLPPEGRPDLRGGFGGPFLFGAGRWLAPQLVIATLSDEQGPLSWQDAEAFEAVATPGMLSHRGRIRDLDVALRLWIDSARTTVIELEVTPTGPTPRQLKASWSGMVFPQQATLEETDGAVRLLAVDGARIELVPDRPMQTPTLDGKSYTWATVDPIDLAPGGRVTVALAVSWSLNGEPDPDRLALRAQLADAAQSRQDNATRWQAYQSAVGASDAQDPLQILALKAAQTLVNNWRGPAGRMRHSSLFPSSNVNYFNGFWAWDSWKHAVALLRFDAELAKEQVRAMFDHQDETGMIADVVYLDPAEDNWRDTKPPLAGWAIETIYRVTKDLDFVRQLYPKLVRYHAFWYADRDHDSDGLCEYGSTDGTLVAARWESGMDNAVRFDDSQMLANGPRAWSLDQESVDLNSYLYREKLALEALARALGEDEAAARWAAEAKALAAQIRHAMFDADSGWFYDIHIETGAIVPVQGPEGFIPLWTGVASAEQAARARETMLDPEVFRTHVPFPTVARNHPEFSDGYWRGLVWLDQAYFAICGLRRFGYEDDAAALTEQLFSNLEGATTPGVPLYENYHPLTGEGQNVKHFSWTAAHLLLLTLRDGPCD
ncbi:MAG: trehalase family glycosidase, partial [Acidobacteriota bacterium]